MTFTVFNLLIGVFKAVYKVQISSGTTHDKGNQNISVSIDHGQTVFGYDCIKQLINFFLSLQCLSVRIAVLDNASGLAPLDNLYFYVCKAPFVSFK